MKQQRRRELEQLDQQCWNTIGAGYKDSSKENIKSQYDNYKRFCNYYFLDTFPVDSWQLVRFAQYLANEGKRPGTVSNHISTIRTLQALKGKPIPDLFDIAIKLELKGLANLSNKVKRKANAMTPQIRMKIYRHVKFSDTTEMVCYTALLTGFYLLLRKSNLIPENFTGIKSFDPDKQLQRRDLKIGRKMVLVDIKWSKTIKKTGRPLQLPLLPLMTKELCPIFWMKEMINAIPAKPDAPLFLIPGRVAGQWVPLTYRKLSMQLKEWTLKAIGQQDGWTLHCLRRGGAVWSFIVDISTEAIRLMGD